MARLLPSSKDTSAADDAEPRVVGVESDEADELLSALSSKSARQVLTALHEEPETPSELADRLDMTLQNVQYHLGNLTDAELVEVVDTVYSEKGREMKVYAPADKPLVMFAGGESQSLGLKQAIYSLLAAVGVLGVLSAVVQALLRGLPSFGLTGAGGADGGSGGDMTAMSTESTRIASEAAATGPPPGLVFFLGGLAVLTLAFAVWYWRGR